MEQITGTSLAQLLSKSEGNNFDPAKETKISKTVLSILKHNLKDYSHTEIEEAYQRAVINIRYPIDCTNYFALY